MSPEALACAERVRAEMRRQGLDVRARVEGCEGLLCGYREGVVRLTLPTLATPEERLRATLLGAMMGLDAREVAWLFEALLPRLVAHEFGHAMRDEAGLLGADVCVEEQIADRVATLISSPMIDARDAVRARGILRDVVARLGGAHEAASLHRNAARARREMGLGADATAVERARTHLQSRYWRDVHAYLRVTAAWALIDLTLHPEDDPDALRRDHLHA